MTIHLFDHTTTTTEMYIIGNKLWDGKSYGIMDDSSTNHCRLDDHNTTAPTAATPTTASTTAMTSTTVTLQLFGFSLEFLFKNMLCGYHSRSHYYHHRSAHNRKELWDGKSYGIMDDSSTNHCRLDDHTTTTTEMYIIGKKLWDGKSYGIMDDSSTNHCRLDDHTTAAPTTATPTTASTTGMTSTTVTLQLFDHTTTTTTEVHIIGKKLWDGKSYGIMDDSSTNHCRLDGDAGYLCLPWLRTPLGHPNNSAEEAYNTAHSHHPPLEQEEWILLNYNIIQLLRKLIKAMQTPF
ncbi:uncharacterized protein [Hyperolius riggenbachi]|uniref:uncharacterized protein n=1 Tax=Hyperolius riggenbachi TaxID=752182 RepID=UPI0035A2B8ED